MTAASLHPALPNKCKKGAKGVQSTQVDLERLPRSDDDRLSSTHDEALPYCSPHIPIGMQQYFGDSNGQTHKVAGNPQCVEISITNCGIVHSFFEG